MTPYQRAQYIKRKLELLKETVTRRIYDEHIESLVDELECEFTILAASIKER